LVDRPYLCVCFCQLAISLGNFLVQAGFPLPFALWVGGRLQTFDVGALLVDFALGLLVILGLAALCAWSRRKTTGQVVKRDRGGG
jgi:hypothetical protein